MCGSSEYRCECCYPQIRSSDYQHHLQERSSLQIDKQVLGADSGSSLPNNFDIKVHRNSTADYLLQWLEHIPQTLV